MMEVPKMKETRYLWLVLILCVLLAACEGQEYDCVGTFEEFAYDPSAWDKFDEVIPPLPPWQIEAVLPENLPPSLDTQVETTRVVNGQVEIWMRRRSTLGVSQGDKLREFLIYQQSTKKFISISAEIGDTGVWVDKLYVSSDGSIWGRNIWYPIDNYDIKNISVLSKFNEDTNRFEFDINSPSIKLESGLYKIIDQAVVVLDTNDLFWIFIPFNGLYSYNSELEETTLIAELSEYDVEFAALAPDGSIFFKNYQSKISIQEGEFFQFFPETGDITPIENPDEPWPDVPRMLVDQKGRLWLNTVGWRESDGTWHMMYPNPDEFFKWAGTSHYWATPSIKLVSSNGYLWFWKYTITYNGTAWYDPDTGEGCWFTNIAADVIEDSDENLWLVADGKLYKYALGE